MALEQMEGFELAGRTVSFQRFSDSCLTYDSFSAPREYSARKGIRAIHAARLP